MRLRLGAFGPLHFRKSTQLPFCRLFGWPGASSSQAGAGLPTEETQATAPSWTIACSPSPSSRSPWFSTSCPASAERGWAGECGHTTSHPSRSMYKRECARLRSLFLLLLLFSLSLLLFRREVVCWAATDCPDVEGEILI